MIPKLTNFVWAFVVVIAALFGRPIYDNFRYSSAERKEFRTLYFDIRHKVDYLTKCQQTPLVMTSEDRTKIMQRFIDVRSEFPRGPLKEIATSVDMALQYKAEDPKTRMENNDVRCAYLQFVGPVKVHDTLNAIDNMDQFLNRV